MADAVNPRVCLLTDDVIAMYTENRVLSDYRDIDLRILNKLSPYPKGVYDQDIFGSMFADRCNCGNIRTPGIKCPRCGSEILSMDQQYSRFARIELPVHYAGKYKVEKIKKLLRANFSIRKDFQTPEFKDTAWNDPIALDCLQWNYDDETGGLIITDQVTDFRKCSYEGLIKIIQEKFNEENLLKELRSYVNQYILVIPMILRAPSVKMVNKNRVLENHDISVLYQNIIYAITEYYNVTFQSMKTEIGKAMFRGSLRKMISSSMDTLSKLMASSKANLARSMQSNRLPNSGRCTVIPDPTLKADEVTLPTHLAYEACRKEFVQYISQMKGVSQKEAEVIYETQSDLDEVQKLFEDFVNGDPKDPNSGLYVVINRAPSLYEYGMFTCKVRLSHDYAMKIPMAICKPTGGDFDGDTYSWYVIPKNMNSMMIDALSARTRVLYKKNHAPLFTPTQEILQGVMMATKVSVTTGSLKSFDNIDQAEDERKSDNGFDYQTLCLIGGKKTTLGRAILTELFDVDMNLYLKDFNHNLTKKDLDFLYINLEDKPDRLDRIQKIQEFAVKVATLSGATAVSVEDLYLDIDQSYMKRMKAIQDDESIPDDIKEIRIREIYAEFQKVEMNKVPEGVKSLIDESVRSDVKELLEMALPQFKVGPDHTFKLTESSLTAGMSAEDFEWHAIENRAIQDIKNQGTPQSGYVTRQMTYTASEYYLEGGEDVNNKGIELPAKEADGRTGIDGKIIDAKKYSPDQLVKVRSLVTSTLGSHAITKDMLTNKFNYKVGSKIGMSLISSFTEQLTQGALALKHGGSLFKRDTSAVIKAPEDGRVIIHDDLGFVELIGKTKSYKWPLVDKFLLNCTNIGNHVKKGEAFGIFNKTFTETYNTENLIKLLGARGSTPDKKFGKNEKVVSECYALNDGVIRYDFRDGGCNKITIDDVEYQFNSADFYFPYDGQHVNKLDRICTGTLDLNAAVVKIPDYVEMFKVFKKQAKELISVAPEIYEFIYVLLIKQRGDHLEALTAMKSIYSSESFFKSLAFGDARKSFQKIDSEGMDFIADPITSLMLPLILNENIR